MPVTCPIQFKILSDVEFRELDYRIMAHVFSSHNELGRFCDEEVYQRDIAARLETAGLGPVRTEVPALVAWRQFRKTYYLDLIVQDSHLYELKTAAAQTGEHKTQLLNYVLLLGLRTGKLVNLRPPQVETWFASTTLTLAERQRVTCDDTGWRDLTPPCNSFRTAFTEMVNELGAFLDTALYEDLITQCLGGSEKVVQPVQLSRAGLDLGRQRCPLLASDVGFRITAHSEGRSHAEAHLRRWLAHTPLRVLQWVNLNRPRIEFTTLLK